MDLFTIFRIARARWKIVLPVLLITLVVAGRIYTDRSEEYSVQGTQILVAGRGQVTAADEVAGVAVGLLEELLVGPSIQRQLAEDGLSDTYSVRLSESGSTLSVEVIGESPEQAVATADQLVELAPGLLAESLDERAARSVAVEQAVGGDVEDAVEVGDGTFRYTTVLVIGPADRSTANPFPATLGTVRSLVTIATSLPFIVRVGDVADGGRYEVTGNVREAPHINIATWGPSPRDALDLHAAIVEGLRAELNELQASLSIDPESRTQMQTLVDGSYVVVTPTSKLRPVAATVILGGGLAIGLATLVEAIAADRRRRAALGTADENGDEPEGGFAAGLRRTLRGMVERARSRTAKGAEPSPDPVDELFAGDARRIEPPATDDVVDEPHTEPSEGPDEPIVAAGRAYRRRT